MRIFLTGGTGFLGSAVARKLRDRGDEVVAYVRNPDKAQGLAAIGCDIVVGSILDTPALTTAMDGVGAVIHAAGVYDVGIPDSARPAMYEGNVTATERVLDAAVAANAERIIYVSTVGVFGDTGGKIVDESYEREREYLSYYEETKHLAHVAAEERIARGAPVIIVAPSVIYGPGDQSAYAQVIDMFLKHRLPAVLLPTNGFCTVHIDDVVDGMVAALDKGRPGESYVLSGDVMTMRRFVDTVAAVAGRKPPRFDMPTSVLRLMAPVGPVVGPLMGLPPNLREMISGGDGATYWASHDKATRELGFGPRSLRDGMRQTLQAEGRL